MTIRVVLCAVLAITLSGAPAPAQPVSPGSTCTGQAGVDWDQQIESCTAIIESPQESPRNRAVAYKNRGNAWNAKGDHDRAIADYSEAIRLDPDYAIAYNNRGLAWTDKRELRPRHRRLQRGDPARSEIRQRLLQPRPRLDTTSRTTTAPSPTSARRSGSIRSYANAYVNRGLAWHFKRDYDRAIADFDEAIRLDPKATPTPTSTAASPGTPRATTTAPSPTSDEAIRLDPERRRRLLQSRRRLSAEGRLRPRHRRLQRGDPARSERRRCLSTTAAVPGTPSATTTAPSPTSTRRSGSIRNDAGAYYQRGLAWQAKGDTRPRHRRPLDGGATRSSGRARRAAEARRETDR